MSLTSEEKYFARKLFKLELFQRNGQSFENFFVQIMQYFHKDFAPIKPQGKFGDRKNDGFIKSEGKYYQVYSPEDPSDSEYNTIKKLVNDFAGLYEFWNDQVTSIKEFYYVINDKYQGGYPTLYPELKNIEQNYSGVKCFPFFAKNLEDIFLELPKDQIHDLIGGIILPSNIEEFEVPIMIEVINYIINLDLPYQEEVIPERPDFNQKIIFNCLNSNIATQLRYGSYQEGSLKEYFRLNSNFAKEDLRNKFNQLYKQGLSLFSQSDDKNDLIFFHILKNAYPSNKMPAKNAVLILMSYYFGYCDIFEEPKLSPTLF